MCRVDILPRGCKQRAVKNHFSLTPSGVKVPPADQLRDSVRSRNADCSTVGPCSRRSVAESGRLNFRPCRTAVSEPRYPVLSGPGSTTESLTARPKMPWAKAHARYLYTCRGLPANCPGVKIRERPLNKQGGIFFEKIFAGRDEAKNNNNGPNPAITKNPAQLSESYNRRIC